MAVCAVLGGCGQPAPYTLGVVLNEDGLRGATMAMDGINASGGINGHPLAFRSVGGAGSTKASVALETAAVLAADPQVLAVIGHTNSSASLAASQVYNARHIVQIAPTTTAPLYSDAGPYSFRLTSSDAHQGVFLANHVLALTPRPRIAALYVNDDYGRPLHEIVVAHLRAGGIALTYDAPYSTSERGATNTEVDNTEMVDALVRSHPNLLIWVGRSSDFMRVVPLLRKSLPALHVIATDGFSGSTADDTLHLLDGVSYVRLVDPYRPGSRLHDLTTRYERQGWGEPSDQAVLSYDAVLILAEALRAGGPKREAIHVWLSRVGSEVPAVQGLSGPITFSPEGDRPPQYFLQTIGQVRGGAKTSP
jgi:branched-chain amino acid transport system substrate-binding protein